MGSMLPPGRRARSSVRRRLGAVGAAAVVALSAAAPVWALGTATVDGRAMVHPLSVELSDGVADATVGQKVQVKAVVTNLGPDRVGPVTVELRTASDGIRVKTALLQSVARLRPGQAASVTWTVCGQVPGTYVLLARATVDGASIESQARLLTVTAGRDRRCT